MHFVDAFRGLFTKGSKPLLVRITPWFKMAEEDVFLPGDGRLHVAHRLHVGGEGQQKSLVPATVFWQPGARKFFNCLLAHFSQTRFVQQKVRKFFKNFQQKCVNYLC